MPRISLRRRVTSAAVSLCLAVGMLIGMGAVQVAMAPPAAATGAAEWSSVQVPWSGSGGPAEIDVSDDGTRATAIWNDGNLPGYAKSASATISGNTATWGSVVSLDNSDSAVNVHVRVSADGSRATAIWSSGSPYHVYSASATISGNTQTWGIPSNLTLSDRAEYAQVTLSDDGTKATAVWQLTFVSPNRVQSKSATISGTSQSWGSVTDLSDGVTDASNPQLALSANGVTATATWMDKPTTGGRISSRSATISGTSATWGSEDSWYDSSSPAGLRMTLSSDGTTALFMWSNQTNHDVLARTATISGNVATFGVQEVVSVSTGPDSFFEGVEVALAADGTRATAAWASDVNPKPRSASATISGNTATWGPVAELSTLAGKFVELTVSSDGSLATAVWLSGDFLKLQSTTATISGNTASWAAETNVYTAPIYQLSNPSIAGSTDGTRATAFWPGGGGESTASAITGTAQVPAVGSVSVSGTPTVEQTLTATANSVTGFPTPTTTWKWQVSDNGTSGWTDISGATSNAFTLTVAQFQKYVRAVATATSSAGSGSANSDASTQIAGVAPDTPAAPTRQTSTTTSITMQWVAPASHNTPITGYTVQVSNDGTTGWATPGAGTGTCTSPGTATSCTLTGLSVGNVRYFRVSATSIMGTSAYSGVSSAVAAASPPLAPTWAAPAFTPSNTQITFNWVAPDNQGSAITGYRLQSAISAGGSYSNVTGSGTCVTSAPTSSATSCTLTGLTNGVVRYYKVAAINLPGTGAYSAEQAAQAATTPGAPTGVVGFPGNQQVSLVWSTPSSDGGAAITGYNVQMSANGGAYSDVPASYSCSAATANTSTATSCTVGGLSNSTTYTFKVLATNAVGSSAYSTASGGATPTPTAPDAPTDVNADVAAAAGQAVVSFTAPTNDGGAAITGYTVTSTPGGLTCTTSGPASGSCPVTGLTNGTAYSFAATATNSQGTSAPSTPAPPITPYTVSDAPTGTNAALGSPTSQVVVSWTAPVFNGGSALTGYTATSSPAGGSCAAVAPATTCTVTSGLTTGVSYTFTVVATNLRGDSAASTASGAVTPAVAPDAPTALTAVPGNGQVALTWVAPVVTGGSAVTSYTVTATQAGNPAGTCTQSAPTTGCTVIGLTNGTVYDFVVTATNAAGTSAASSPVAATPSKIPGRPTTVTATVAAAAGQADVSFVAPVSDGGAAISGYTVTSAPSGLTCTVPGTDPAPLHCTVSGLTNGTPYSFSVTAANSQGTGAASTPSDPVVPYTVPGTPTSANAALGSPTSQVVVSWTAPVFNGGSALTGYTVTSAPAGGGCVAVAPATTCTITSGLSNAVSYTFSVVATNARGDSAASSASGAVVPTVPPNPPTGLAAVPGNLEVALAWNPVVAPDDGGSAVLWYSVNATQAGIPAGSCVVESPGCTITGLTNGLAYDFVITATSSAGVSATSSSVSASPRTTPAAPTITAVTADDSSAVATFTGPTPANNGGNAVSGFRVSYGSGTFVCPGGASASPCTVPGLTNGTTYVFTVAATNAAGYGVESAPSAPVTPRAVPTAPTGVTTSPGNQSLEVSWTAPVSDNGSPVSGYTVYVSTAPGSGYAPPPSGSCTGVVTTTSCAVTGLANGTGYYVKVSATNAAGEGPLSAASTANTPRTVPGAPTGVVGDPGNGQVSVEWVAPTDTGGNAVSGWTVTASNGIVQSCALNETPCVVSGLTNAEEYSFTVAAINGAGTGPASSPSPPVTPFTLPDTPAPPTGLTSDSAVSLSWVAPNANGRPVTGYNVQQADDAGGPWSAVAAGTCTSAPTSAATTCTVTGLTNGSDYYFRISAINAAPAQSSWSGASAALIPATSPAAPTITAADAGNASAIVSWIAPSAGGGTITAYSVIASGGGGQQCSAVPPAVTTCTVVNLTNGQSYTFTVIAHSALGDSPASAPSSAVIPRTAPGAPTIASVTPADGAVAVSWNAPAFNGGAALIGYLVTSSQGQSCSTTAVPPALPASACTVSGLTNGAAYSFSVVAINTAYTGLASVPSAPTTPFTNPAPVTNIMALSGDSQLTVSWAGSADNGSPITNYTATVTPGGGSCSTIATPPAPAATNCVITGLTNGTNYSIQVSSTNAAGTNLTPAIPGTGTPQIPSPDGMDISASIPGGAVAGRPATFDVTVSPKAGRDATSGVGARIATQPADMLSGPAWVLIGDRVLCIANVVNGHGSCVGKLSTAKQQVITVRFSNASATVSGMLTMTVMPVKVSISGYITYRGCHGPRGDIHRRCSTFARLKGFTAGSRQLVRVKGSKLSGSRRVRSNAAGAWKATVQLRPGSRKARVWANATSGKSPKITIHPH